MTASLVSLSNSVQILCKNGRLMAKSVIFNMSAADILDFVKFEFYWYNRLQDPIFCVCVKFCANWLKMAELWPFNGFQDDRRRHLGFLTYVNFDGKSGCRTPFSVYVSNLVQIYAKMADLWPKVWFSIWRPPPSWILENWNFSSKTGYGTPFSGPLWNFVQIGWKMAELWPFNEI